MTFERVLPFQQLGIGGDQHGAFDDGGRRDDAVGGVFVRHGETRRKHGDFAVDGKLDQSGGEKLGTPFNRRLRKPQALRAARQALIWRLKDKCVEGRLRRMGLIGLGQGRPAPRRCPAAGWRIADQRGAWRSGGLAEVFKDAHEHRALDDEGDPPQGRAAVSAAPRVDLDDARNEPARERAPGVAVGAGCGGG